MIESLSFVKMVNLRIVSNQFSSAEHNLNPPVEKVSCNHRHNFTVFIFPVERRLRSQRSGSCSSPPPLSCNDADSGGDRSQNIPMFPIPM